MLELEAGPRQMSRVSGLSYGIIQHIKSGSWVYLAHRGHVGQGMRSLFNLVHEFLTDALAKIPQDVFLYLMQLGGGSFVPVNLHTLTVSLWWNTSSFVRYSPASKAASASSSISSISCIV